MKKRGTDFERMCEYARKVAADPRDFECSAELRALVDKLQNDETGDGSLTPGRIPVWELARDLCKAAGNFRAVCMGLEDMFGVGLALLPPNVEVIEDRVSDLEERVRLLEMSIGGNR